MMVLTLQTQSYAPWNLDGFHFGPYLFCSLGMLGGESGFLNKKIYSIAGLGVLVRNDYLNFSNFQLSISLYPFVPGQGNFIKWNSYSSSDYGFQNFEINKPQIANYR